MPPAHNIRKRHIIHHVAISGVFLLVVGLLWAIFTWPDEQKQSVAETNSQKKPSQLITQVSRSQHDLPYCAGDKLQRYDVYLPRQKSTKPLPAVIFIHGGGWIRGDKINGLVDYYGSELVRRGFAVVSVNYRLAPKHVYPVQNQDVACAVTTVVKNAAKYNIDPERLGLHGDSAGGLLAAMYTLTHGQDQPSIKAVVEFYGTADLASQIERKPQGSFASMYLGSNDLSLARQASPLHQPIGGTPPFLLFHGNQDTTVGIDHSKRFYEKLRRDNPRSRFVEVKGGKHYFTKKNTPDISAIKDMLIAFYSTHLDEEPSATTR